MTTSSKKPTLAIADLIDSIIISLKNNQYPTDKIAFKFLTAARACSNADPNSSLRRSIFKQMRTDYKKYCSSRDATTVQNEIGKGIHKINPIWKEHEAVILSKTLPVPVKEKRISFRQTVTAKNYYISRLWYNNQG
jgi:hypothetical protein